MKLINFNSSRSFFQHRQFKNFLSLFVLVYSDFLQPNNFRWLSKSLVMERFRRYEVTTFLENLSFKEAKKQLKCKTNEQNILAIALLDGILSH